MGMFIDVLALYSVCYILFLWAKIDVVGDMLKTLSTY